MADNLSAIEGGWLGRPALLPEGVCLADFRAYMPAHKYIFMPTGELWPAASVNARIPAIQTGVDEKRKPVKIAASLWLDQNRPVEQWTWAPGQPQLIEGQLLIDGGWQERPGVFMFNQYRPPILKLGDPSADACKAWLDLGARLYPDTFEQHLAPWLAYRVQQPEVKINHALVLGGAQGIGKDCLLEPVVRAVGPWNCAEVSPSQLQGRFNGWVKCVILRVSEAHDLGEFKSYAFYDHMKTYIAAPPMALRVDEKNIREHMVPNLVGVVFTTNHRDGLYLPADDRRHHVNWSEATRDDFDPAIWRWYDQGGDGCVAAYLRALDLTGFDPKAPPPKTAAWRAMVDTGRAAEDAELADILDKLGNPAAVTVDQVQHEADFEGFDPVSGKRSGFAAYLEDRKANAKKVAHRFEDNGYVPIRNPDDHRDGQWRIGGRRRVVYARADLSERERLAAAQALARR
jgi:hypothetical protein